MKIRKYLLQRTAERIKWDNTWKAIAISPVTIRNCTKSVSCSSCYYYLGLCSSVTSCDRWNVCMPLKCICWNPNPISQCDDVRKWGLWEVISSHYLRRVEPSWIGFLPLWKDRSQFASCGCLQPGSGLSSDTSFEGTLDALNVQNSKRLMLLFKTLSLWCPIIAAQTMTPP